MLIKAITSNNGNISRITNYGKYKGKHICIDTWKQLNQIIEKRCVIWDKDNQWVYFKHKKGWTV